MSPTLVTPCSTCHLKRRITVASIVIAGHAAYFQPDLGGGRSAGRGDRDLCQVGVVHLLPGQAVRHQDTFRCVWHCQWQGE